MNNKEFLKHIIQIIDMNAQWEHEPVVLENFAAMRAQATSFLDSIVSLERIYKDLNCSQAELLDAIEKVIGNGK